MDEITIIIFKDGSFCIPKNENDRLSIEKDSTFLSTICVSPPSSKDQSSKGCSSGEDKDLKRYCLDLAAKSSEYHGESNNAERLVSEAKVIYAYFTE